MDLIRKRHYAHHTTQEVIHSGLYLLLVFPHIRWLNWTDHFFQIYVDQCLRFFAPLNAKIIVMTGLLQLYHNTSLHVVVDELFFNSLFTSCFSILPYHKKLLLCISLHIALIHNHHGHWMCALDPNFQCYLLCFYTTVICERLQLAWFIPRRLFCLTISTITHILVF